MCPRLTESDISESIRYAEDIYKTNPAKFEYARKILLTHLQLHENIIQTVKDIIAEYSLGYDTRMLFIGIVGLMNKESGSP